MVYVVEIDVFAFVGFLFVTFVLAFFINIYFSYISCFSLLFSSFGVSILLFPSWHSDVVTTLQQSRGWRCHNVVARSKMKVVATSVSDVVTTSLSDVVKTLPQRCYNVTITLSIWFLGHFITDNSDFFPVIETWESYKITWVLNSVLGNRDAP